jgi:hypothetical protein
MTNNEKGFLKNKLQKMRMNDDSKVDLTKMKLASPLSVVGDGIKRVAKSVVNSVTGMGVQSSRKNILQKAIKSPFVPTQALGTTTSKMKNQLKREAPETLVAPKRSDFDSNESHAEAVRKFKQYGNWASNK